MNSNGLTYIDYSFGLSDKLDGRTKPTNGKEFYYDLSAHREFSSESKWREKFKEVPTSIFNFLEKQREKTHYYRGEPVVEVSSAYNGMCVYKMKSILGLSYYPIEGEVDIYSINKGIKDRGYKVFINPSQIVLYTQDYRKYV